MGFFELLRRFSRACNLLPCPRCGRGDGGGANRFCAACLAELSRIPAGPRCPGCGGALDGVLAQCSACLAEAEERPWNGAVTLFEYTGAARELVHDFKFHGRPELARPFGALAAEALREARFRADLVVPVPLHWTRLWRRSYNQAGLFGERLAAELGIPCRNALRRRKRTRRQAGLRREQRARNPRGAFAVRDPDAVTGRPVLLVDDVFTTGATLTAAAKVLRAAGCGPIFVVTIARTPRYRRS